MTGYLAGPTPRAFAHRGWHTDSLTGLENTMVAFQRAIAEGFRYLETDVHVTNDGRLVAFHDTVLDRVTDRFGPIAALPWSEVAKAKIGGKEPIPLFAEVLDAFPDSMFNIDPKTDNAVGPLIDAIRDAGAMDRVCLGSFSAKRLRVLRQAFGPKVATSLGPTEVMSAVNLTRRLVRRDLGAIGAVAAQVPVRQSRVSIITPGLVTRCHDAGLEVHAWTIDDATEMDRLLDLGVDGIMTDRPDVLRDVLSRRGHAL